MNDIYLPQAARPRNLRAIALLAVVLLAVILGILWLYSHTFIRISVANPSAGEFTYTVIDQKNGASTTTKSSSPNLKKLVKKGSYEVLVNQQETSYYGTLDTSSFMRTVSIKASLQAEKAREFVGNNPDPCMHYSASILFSYGCDANYDNLRVHLPATVASPTIVESPPDTTQNNLSIIGIFELNGKNMIALNNVLEFDDASTQIYELRPDFQLVGGTQLSGLNPNNPYALEKYGSGFVVYGQDFEQLFYYESVGAAPKEIAIENPKPEKKETLLAFGLSTRGDRLALAFSDTDKRASEDTKQAATAETVVQVYQGNTTKSFRFKGDSHTVKLCGSKYLCLVAERQLTVYDISGAEPKEHFRVNNVNAIENDNGRLAVIKSEGLLSIDLDQKSGYHQYSFGSYQFCGIESVIGGGYILCLIDPRDNRVAIRVDPEKPNIDSIDKKVLAIVDQPFVETVSPYKSIIYITPDLGELIYNPAFNGYGPDPVIRQKATKDLDDLLVRIGLDRSAYTIINTQL